MQDEIHTFNPPSGFGSPIPIDQSGSIFGGPSSFGFPPASSFGTSFPGEPYGGALPYGDAVRYGNAIPHGGVIPYGGTPTGVSFGVPPPFGVSGAKRKNVKNLRMRRDTIEIRAKACPSCLANKKELRRKIARKPAAAIKMVKNSILIKFTCASRNFKNALGGHYTTNLF